ncbi:hypothetical protein ACFY4C_15270 [Actinomadura viridis]|uniref:hypothetical protein n=1 Tax=Actinomadura viridis TaxID=58110 RepID=UPI0036BDFD43
MNGILAAFGATGLYYAGFAIFKPAADRMEPLRGDRIRHMLRVILTDPVFLAGLVLVLGGLALQILALAELSLSIAVPIFMSGVILLLLVALAFFGDRLTGREWLSLVLIGAALLLITASIGNPPPIRAVDVPLWKLAVIVAPALVVPLVLLLTGEHRPDGRHARPITGIGYGLGAGVPIGTAELCIKGWSDSGIGSGSLLTPYPYVTVAASVVGFGILMIAFQRCRVSIVATVMTVSAKAHLLVTGSFMYGEPWPQDTRYFAMRLGALALAAIALLQFPRHRPLPDPEPPGAPAHAPSRDLPGDPAPGTAHLGRSSFGLPPAPGPHARPPSAPDRSASPHPFVPGPRPGNGPGSYDAGGPPRPHAQAPPTSGPYARDPLGRGPDGRIPFEDDAYEI